MKHFLLTALCAAWGFFCQSQTPFIQSNAIPTGMVIRLDTVSNNLTEKLDRISSTIRSFQSSVTNRMETESQTIKSVDSVHAAQLKQITDKTERDRLEIQLNRERERHKFEKHKVQSEKLSLQLEKYRTLYNTVNAQVLDFKKTANEYDTVIGQMKFIQKEKPVLGEDNISVLAFYGEMVKAAERTKGPLDGVTKLIEALKTTIDSFEKRQNRFNVFSSAEPASVINKNLDQELRVADSISGQVGKAIAEVNKGIEAFREVTKKTDEVLKKSQGDIAKLYDKYKAPEENDGESLQALAGITQPLGTQGQLVPNISLLGFKKVSNETSSMAAQLRLFVGANTQNNTFNTNYKIFIPEMSNFGFMADFSLGFIPSIRSFKTDPLTKQPIKKLGINLGAYYLGKSLNHVKDSSQFNIGMLQFKTGFQYVLIGNVLSVYANINPFFLSNGIADFKQSYSYTKKLRTFVDFGLECYLDLIGKQKKDGLYLDLDLGFISAGGDVQALSTSEDPLIPRIKLSLVKNFNF